jgi:transcriptional regulator with GAF, ATPase, and Fis domain
VGDYAPVANTGPDQADLTFERIIGNSAVLEQVGQAVPTDLTVFIKGKTGTGKELIAHASQR